MATLHKGDDDDDDDDNNISPLVHCASNTSVHLAIAFQIFLQVFFLVQWISYLKFLEKNR